MRPFTDERTRTPVRVKKVQAPPSFADALRVESDQDHSPTPEGQAYLQGLHHHQAGAARFLDLFRRKRDSGELTDQHLLVAGDDIFGDHSNDGE